ncbi:MAG: formylglycine-generating enzyme family protein [Cyclobacteriaceae bacterium]
MKCKMILLAVLSTMSLYAQQHGDAKIFAISKNVEIEMIWIEPGSFLMGSPDNELERNATREKQHAVTLTKGFWIAKTETSQKTWESVMKDNPSKIQGSDLPVEQVSWNRAQEFIRKINKNGARFRLPYEAEWEYACRAGSTTAYAGRRDQMTWHSGNSNRTTHAVGSKTANAWGLFNMHGNVSEMCLDWFQEDISELTIDSKGPATGERRVERGGQYTGRIRHTRSADRSSNVPDGSSFFVGFRLVHD